LLCLDYQTCNDHLELNVGFFIYSISLISILGQSTYCILKESVWACGIYHKSQTNPFWRQECWKYEAKFEVHDFHKKIWNDYAGQKFNFCNLQTQIIVLFTFITITISRSLKKINTIKIKFSTWSFFIIKETFIQSNIHTTQQKWRNNEWYQVQWQLNKK
jgi:hypothetical protein